MAGAEPYVLTLAERDVDALFSNELEALLRERSAIGPVLGGADATSEQVTQTMRRVRAMELDQRMGIYLADRIRNQRQWYGERSEANRKSSTFWLFAVGLSQLAGATAAIAMVRWPSAQFNAAAVCSSIAAAVMAWLQVKRHQELAHSYGLAAHELGLIEARARHVSTNEEFSAFVADAENAISREHTMWVARREVIG